MDVWVLGTVWIEEYVGGFKARLDSLEKAEG
jgi:hypothetical protein